MNQVYSTVVDTDTSAVSVVAVELQVRPSRSRFRNYILVDAIRIDTNERLYTLEAQRAPGLDITPETAFDYLYFTLEVQRNVVEADGNTSLTHRALHAGSSPYRRYRQSEINRMDIAQRRLIRVEQPGSHHYNTLFVVMEKDLDGTHILRHARKSHLTVLKNETGRKYSPFHAGWFADRFSIWFMEDVDTLIEQSDTPIHREDALEYARENRFEYSVPKRLTDSSDDIAKWLMGHTPKHPVSTLFKHQVTWKDTELVYRTIGDDDFQYYRSIDGKVIVTFAKNPLRDLLQCLGALVGYILTTNDTQIAKNLGVEWYKLLDNPELTALELIEFYDRNEEFLEI